jgi:hypothetical protein
MPAASDPLQAVTAGNDQDDGRNELDPPRGTRSVRKDDSKESTCPERHETDDRRSHDDAQADDTPRPDVGAEPIAG